MENINQWVMLLGNFGFPVVVAVYLLMRFEKKIEALTIVINNLQNTIRENSRKDN
jgi:YvrJ protein family